MSNGCKAERNFLHPSPSRVLMHNMPANSTDRVCSISKFDNLETASNDIKMFGASVSEGAVGQEPKALTQHVPERQWSLVVSGPTFKKSQRFFHWVVIHQIPSDYSAASPFKWKVLLNDVSGKKLQLPEETPTLHNSVVTSESRHNPVVKNR